LAQQVRAQVVWGVPPASGAVLAVTRIKRTIFVFVAEKNAKGTLPGNAG